MKITDEFIENSILPEYFSDALDLQPGGTLDEDQFVEITTLIFEHAILRIKEYPAAVQHLKSRKYASARSGIDRFDSFHSSLVELRRTLRSLMSGIIITSAISDQTGIIDYKKKWEPYDDNERSKFKFYFHHQVIYQQYKKVNTLEELAGFNEDFHHYLVEMAFKFAEIFIQRLTYTIEYLKDEEAFKEVCKEAKLNLGNFRNEIEKLKRRPLDINHIGT